MSIVGLWPELSKYVERYAADFEKVLSGGPGMAGLSVVTFRHEEELLSRYPDFEEAYVREIPQQKS